MILFNCFRVVQRHLSLRVVREGTSHSSDMSTVCRHSAPHYGRALRPHGHWGQKTGPSCVVWL